MPTVAVIDYGMGNLHSVAKALEHVAPGVAVHVTADPAAILAAERVVFPGVGAIRDCMAEIRRLRIDRVLHELVDRRTPLLAICVGMQALMDSSEENGGVDCLGILPGRVRFFGDDLRDALGNRLKVPHMGWSRVHQSVRHPLWAGIEQDARFYFVHSYCIEADRPQDVAGETEYGRHFAAALAHDNLFAVQFHPEKSHTAGLQLLANFMQWKGSC